MIPAKIRVRPLLSAQRALLGQVAASLRAVTCEWRDTHVQVQFIFDGEISDEDRDDVHAIGAEIIADFPAPWTISEDLLRETIPPTRDRWR